MADEWNEKLRCGHCRNTGTVSLSQSEADWAPTVHTISCDFKVVQTEYGPDFHCVACSVPAAP
jgi:hypothetical protein